jgi:large subunit ribosomal protein L5
MQARLYKEYKDKVQKEMMEEYNYKNVMQVPRLEKIVVNTCLSEAIQNVKLLTAAANELTLITGQKSVITKAKKSVSNFKLREGMPLGAKVTLRSDKMWEFLDRLIAISMPRIRDFRGINPNGFDGRGNYSMGIVEQLIFPELNFDDIKKINGMNITFVTTAKTDAEGRSLLKRLGMPFKKENK